jgi:hypothetical protein
MSDTQDRGDLDVRIRELVARAVADAPTPPDVDAAALPVLQPAPDNRRWWIGGGAAILAAATLITAFVLVGDTDDKVTTPATPPTAAPTAVPTTVPTTSGTPGTAGATVSHPGAFLTAGPDGVVERRDGQARTLTTDPMEMALDAGDGQIIVQREMGPTVPGEEGATVPLAVAADGSLSELFGGIADWGGGVRLHDVEVVDGRRLLLYSVFVGDPPRPEVVYVIDLDSGTREEIGETDGARRLHLATTGLIVGTWQTQLTRGIQVQAVPGSPAATAGPPSAADLGLAESYSDCGDCPSAFTVNPDGEEILWVANGELASRFISPSVSRLTPIVPTPAGVIDDVDFQNGGVLFSFGVDEQPRAPVLMTLDGSRAPTLEGTTATFASSLAPTEFPPPTVVTSPTTPPVADDAAVLLTAGPDGVVEHRGAETRMLTSEPMEIALAAPDGQVIVQRHAGDGEGVGWTDADTAPLVLSEDGSLRPLFDTVDWDGGVVLHDIEVVDGRQMLLFSLEVGTNDPETADETLYVVDLDTEERTEVAAGIGGWEHGTSSLHLVTTGLVVGERSAMVEHGIFIDDVPTPGVAASLPTPADLGLEETYTECADCPSGFAVAPDGVTFAWVDGDELVVHVIGEQTEKERIALPSRLDCCGTLDYVQSADAFLWSADNYVDPPPVPVLIARDGTVTTLGGAVATASPGGLAEPASPPATTVPSATTVPPLPPTGSAALVTVGPDGVVEHVGTETRTLTTEEMVRALPMGDANTLVQRHAGTGDRWSDADTVPLVLAPDGSLSPLFEGFDWGGAVVLHDIEVVGEQRLLLYSVQGPLVPQQANESLYVVDLDSAERTEVAPDIGGWEFGTGRLHLATTGLVVGESWAEATHSLAIYAVPGSSASEAAVPNAADLGLDETFVQCLECPRGFTVTSDGQTIGWVADGGVVTVSLGSATGEAAAVGGVPSGIVTDLDLTDTAALLSFAPEEQPAPFLVLLDGSDSVLEGTTAAFGPAG